MKENIQQLLINQEGLEKIESATLHLNEQSIAFRYSIIHVTKRYYVFFLIAKLFARFTIMKCE